MVQFKHLVLLVAIVLVRGTSLQAVNVLVDTDKYDMYLQARQYLNVSTGFYLVMQPDCNLILYNRSLPIRSTNTSCTARVTDLRAHLGSMSLTADDALYLTINANGTDDDISIYPLWGYSWADEDNIPLYPYMLLRDSGRCDFYDLDGKRLYGTGYHQEDDENLTEDEFLYSYRGPVPRLTPNASDLSSMPNIAYPFPPELAWKPQASLDGFPYLPAGYFLSQGSKLQTVDHRFALMLGPDCRMQSKATPGNGSELVLWETTTGSYNSSQVTEAGCELTLQQDGRLVIRSTNVSGVVYWNSSTAAGNDAVTWILRLSSSDGSLSIRDIENSSRVLWSNANQIIPVPVQSNDRTVIWIVVGVIVGVFMVAALALVIYLCVWSNILADPAEKAFRKYEKAFRQRLEEAGRKSLTRFSETKIKQATNNFGNSIGSGGFGDVFYGKLPDGQEIAAKVLSAESHQSMHEFYNEIELLSVVQHRYLVSLLGYRCTRKQQILVYEYMSGGDLQQKLQGESAALNPLTWSQRTSIALQVAEGLEYLHDKCSPSIIHRDVKSSNILLTEKMVAKVADFGLSKLRKKEATHVTTDVKGTPGYFDPEYHETGLLTDKSDVYAFGIVLMEILTGQNQMYIAHRVAEARKRELGVYELPDPNLKEIYDRDQFVSMIELALWCVTKRTGDRPFMRQVVQRLREMGLTPVEPSSDLGDSEDGPRVMLPSLGIDMAENSEPDQYGHSCMLPLSDSSSSGMNSETLQSGFQFRKNGR